MRRRRALGVCGAILATTFPAFAQGPRRRPRIGLLIPGTPASFAERIAALREGLGEHGMHESRTVELVFRHADGDIDRLPALARELIDLEVDVIVTSATPSIRAAMAATTQVPIVMAASASAVREGLVASLARPGGNVTGLTYLIPDLAAKHVELLVTIVPELTRLAVLWGTAGSGPIVVETAAAAMAGRNERVMSQEIRSARDIEDAFAAMTSERIQAAIVVDGPLLSLHRNRVALLAQERRLPMISTLREHVDAGLLVSYGPNLLEGFRRAAYFVDRVLKGVSPAELPIEQPTRFELVISRRTARSLGLTLAPMVLARADEVIE